MPKTEDLVKGDGSRKVEIKRQTEQRRREANCRGNSSVYKGDDKS
jgi:hypothetical protein